MSISNHKGDIGEAAFRLEAVRKGYWVGEMPQDCPYDFVLDDHTGKLKKIQVKYRTMGKHGSVSIRIASDSHTNRRTYSSENIDAFALYVDDLDEVFLIPIEEVENVKEVTLRVHPPKNGQKLGIRLLENYKF